MMMRMRRPLARAAVVGARTRTSSAVACASGLEDDRVFEASEAAYLADAAPNGTAASIALPERRWAIPRRDLIAVGVMVEKAASGSAA